MSSLVTNVYGCLVMVVASSAGCFASDDPPVSESGSLPTHPGSASGRVGEGLPCQVESLLASKCRSCHGTTLAAPMRLLSYADLVAPSQSNPAKSTAAVSLERMASASAPMPPSGAPATDAEITAFTEWVDAGLPRSRSSSCKTGSAQDAGTRQQAVIACTSNKMWSGPESGEMNPGKACISCHATKANAPTLAIGGTVYPTLAEPDLCQGVNGGARVEVTDAAGNVFSMPVGPTGNFLLANRNVVMPFTAKVIRDDGTERSMTTPQSNGDCNVCHAERPQNVAPGRIRMP
jgi:hypothetical protein